MRNYINNLKANSKKGFSLVELIIVIAIMAILVGVVASQVIPYMEKSRKGKDQQQLSSLTTSIVTAVSDHSTAITTFGETKIVDMKADTSTTDVFDDEFETTLCSLLSSDGNASSIKLSDYVTGLIKKFKSKVYKDQADKDAVGAVFDSTSNNAVATYVGGGYATAKKKDVKLVAEAE